MNWAFDISLKSRAVLKTFIDSYPLEELNKIPMGFNNNIIWNIAHTIAVQQSLVYRLSGLPTLISQEMLETFAKGTRPERDLIQVEVDEIKNLLFTTIERTREDYGNGVFQVYQEYTVTTKNTLTNVNEAIEFNNFHEGIHLGYILALKKSI